MKIFKRGLTGNKVGDARNLPIINKGIKEWKTATSNSPLPEGDYANHPFCGQAKVLRFNKTKSLIKSAIYHLVMIWV